MLDFLRELLDPLFGLLGLLLTTFHAWGAPWWLAIVMLTVVVRAALFPLTLRGIKNARGLQELAPDTKRIRDEHGSDPRKQREDLTKLYAERRVSPVGGCLPLVAQMPVFVALYLTIKEFENLESFRTGGLLWFGDLAAADPFFVLPVLYVVTMMAAQEFAIRNAAPEQRRLMRLLPVVFGVFVAGLPAGLLVYWIASNVVSLVQNLFVYGRASGSAGDGGADAGPGASGRPGPPPQPDERASDRHGEADGARHERGVSGHPR